MIDDHFRARIVLISALGSEGNAPEPPLGMGVLLSDTLVLTCAHVVAKATEHDPFDRDRPPRGVIVRLAIARRGDDGVANATVAENGWFPKQSVRAHDEPADIALLVLARGQLMTGAVPPLSLSVAVSPTGSEGRLLGLVSAGTQTDLMPMHGTVGDAKGDGFYAFERHAATGYWIEPGCSGAPVRTAADSSLLGLVVQEEGDQTKGIAFLIPIRDIRRALDLAGMPFRSPDTGQLALVNMWADSAFGAATGEAEKVKRFVGLYSGKASKPSPFVGRDAELTLLDQLVANETAICFIGGRAGMGKSALMLHAAAAILRDRPWVKLLLLPISLRFGTADQVAGLAVLAAQLQALIPALRTRGGSGDPGAYRSLIAAGWQAIRSHFRDRFVLLVDAVDEALDGWIEDGLLPRELPSNLVLIVSGRTAAPDVVVPEWMQIGGASATVETRTVAMEPLPIGAVAEAIAQLGLSFHNRSDRHGLLEELYRLTDAGDPLLVSLWVTALIDTPRQRAVSISSLQLMRPGISGYLDEWFKQQKTIWKAQGHRLTRHVVEPLLKLLGVAEGPMNAADICGLLASQGKPTEWTERTVDTLLSSSWRILADAGGEAYTFVHPRIRYHYADELENACQIQSLRADFVAWGRSQIAGMSCASKEFSTYVLENHCSHVCSAADALGTTGVLEAIEEVLRCEHWPRKWLEHHGTYGRYIADLRKLDALLRRLGEPRARAASLWCQLCLKSISSIGENIPPVVLEALLTSGAWSASRVHSYVKSVYTDGRRFATLAGVLPYAGDAARRALINDLLFEAPPVTEPRARAMALARVLDYEFERRDAVLSDAQACALAVVDARGSTAAISLVARHLRPDERLRTLDIAVKSAATLADELTRAAALAEVATACAADERPLFAITKELERLGSPLSFERLFHSVLEHRTLSPSLWLRLFDIVCRQEDALVATSGILALLDVVPKADTGVERAVDYAAQIIDSRLKTEYELGLCQRFPGLRDVLQGRIALALETFVPDARVAKMLARLSSWSDRGPAHWETALKILCSPAGTRNCEAAALALLDSARDYDGVAERCIALVPGIVDVDAFESFVTRLVARLPSRDSRDKLLRCLRSLPEQPRVARGLAAVARAITDEADALVDEAIEHATAMNHQPTQCSVLCAVSKRLLEGQRERVLRCAIRCAASIGEREDRIRNLGMVAVECRDLPELAVEAFEAANTIDDQAEAGKALISLASGRSGMYRSGEIERLLRFVPAIRDERQGAARLSEVARRLLLTEDQFLLLLDGIAKIRSETYRGEALVHLSTQLGRFPDCAEQFIAVLGTRVHPRCRARIYQQIYVHFGHRREILELVLHGLPEETEPRAVATYFASLEGVSSVCQRALGAHIFPVELTADAIDLIAGKAANAERTIEQLESSLDNGWTAGVKEILAAIAWRLSDRPETLDVARRCMALVTDSETRARVCPFVEGMFETITVGSAVLRLTHPATPSLPAAACAKLYLSDSRTNDETFDAPRRLAAALSPLDVVPFCPTRSEALTLLASFVGFATPSEEVDAELGNCADAIETVSAWWP